jgi:hypothetical protein
VLAIAWMARTKDSPLIPRPPVRSPALTTSGPWPTQPLVLTA